jgi:hypothetical protein
MSIRRVPGRYQSKVDVVNSHALLVSSSSLVKSGAEWRCNGLSEDSEFME